MGNIQIVEYVLSTLKPVREKQRGTERGMETERLESCREIENGCQHEKPHDYDAVFTLNVNPLDCMHND